MSTLVIAMEGVIAGELTDPESLFSSRVIPLGMTLAKTLSPTYRIVFATKWQRAEEVERWLLDRGADFHWDVCAPPSWEVRNDAELRAWQVQWQRSGQARVDLYIDTDPAACAAVRALGVPIMLFAGPTSPPPIEIGPPRAWRELVRETDHRLLGKDARWEEET